VMPFAGIVLLGLGLAPSTHWHRMVMEDEWLECLISIPMIAILPFAAVIAAVRTTAPTNLVRTGAFAGLVSGSISAMAYALHCTDDSLPFVAIWYGGTIVLCTMAGAILGPGCCVGSSAVSRRREPVTDRSFLPNSSMRRISSCLVDEQEPGYVKTNRWCNVAAAGGGVIQRIRRSYDFGQAVLAKRGQAGRPWAIGPARWMEFCVCFSPQDAWLLRRASPRGEQTRLEIPGGGEVSDDSELS
jgi:hypothetical protein